jgi:hypothetical protein
LLVLERKKVMTVAELFAYTKEQIAGLEIFRVLNDGLEEVERVARISSVFHARCMALIAVASPLGTRFLRGSMQ